MFRTVKVLNNFSENTKTVIFLYKCRYGTPWLSDAKTKTTKTYGLVLYTYVVLKRRFFFLNIGIKHGFSCINVCQVPREVLKTEAEGRGFQHLPRDLANVNVLENNV